MKVFKMNVAVGDYRLFFVGNANGRIEGKLIPGVTLPQEIVIPGRDDGNEDIYFLGNVYVRPIEPELSVSLTDVQVDSSYTVEMSGLPSVQKYGQSQVVVRCYDTVGKLVFSGESVSFPSQQGRKRVVKCTFQSALQHITRGVTNSGWNNRDLIWQYEK